MKKNRLWYIVKHMKGRERLVRGGVFVGLIVGLLFLFFAVPISISTPADDIQAITQNTAPVGVPLASTIPSVEAQSSPNPVKITIPSIHINVAILAMGIAPGGRMAVPDDFVNAGWYSLGPRPGETGTAVIGAHVDNGGAINGVFKYLRDIRMNADVYVTDSNMTTYHFKVMGKAIYNYKATDTQKVFTSSDDKTYLNLITCYGTWLPQEKTYNQRLVIFTELVP